MSAGERALERLRREIAEVSPAEAAALVERGAVLVDIREPMELAAGTPAPAVCINRDRLELRIGEFADDTAKILLVLCNSGVRSLFAADDLARIGYRDVRSVAGGFQRWKREGLPLRQVAVLGTSERERYARHLMLPEIGEAGQARLAQSRIALVGAGGLGSPAALYLAAAGVGTLTLIDDDVVDRSNLQRQILHTDASTGLPKVESARATLKALNPGVRVNTVPARLTVANVEQILADHDAVVDGSDNFPTRYLVNDACLRLALPDVQGSVFRFEGQVGVFGRGNSGSTGPCYRCLYPQPPPAELAPSCADAGVLGVLPGVIGLLQATETLKVLLGIGEPLIGRMLHYDALQGRFTHFEVSRDPACAYCADGAEFPGYVDYEQLCAG